METQSVIDCKHDVRRHRTDLVGNPIDRNGPDLFSLGFRVTIETRFRFQQAAPERDKPG